MKLISLLLATLLTFTNVAAQTPPPVSIKGQADTSKLLPKWNLQVPNSQATNLGGIDALVETGNENILSNPGFEHSSYFTGWTSAVTGTAVATNSAVTSTPIAGKKNARTSCAGGASGGTCTIYQDVATTKALQFITSMKLDADIADGSVRVYSRKDGANYQAVQVYTAEPTIVKVPVTAGTTSTGIALHITVAASQTIVVDYDTMHVGAQNLKTEVPTCNGSIECEDEFSAKVSSADAVSDENLDFINGACTDATLGEATCTFNSVFTVAPNCTCTSVQSGSTNDETCDVETVSASSILIVTRSNNTKADRAFNLSCQKTGVDYTAAKAVSPGFSTTNSDTDWVDCGLTTSDFVGFGTVSSIEDLCKRQGSDLIMRLKFTGGTSTATEARVNLKINGTALTSASTSKIPTIQLAGNAVYGVSTANQPVVLIEPSVGYFTFGQQQAASAGLTKLNGSSWLSSASPVSFEARAPINGWENSNIIIGQFNGLESCTDTYECTDEFSAQISATGVISNENVDWISGNCSVASGAATCTLVSGLKGGGVSLSNAMNCSTNGVANTRIPIIASATSSTIVFEVANTSGVSTAAVQSVRCQKAGSDFIAKTAKAVASDQNIRTPGVVNGITFRFNFAGSSTTTAVCSSTPCTVNQNKGGIVTGVTRSSAGVYSIALSGLADDSYHCSYSLRNWASGATYECYFPTKTSSALSMTCGSSAGSSGMDVAADVICEAEKTP